jgi:hypothetical protein
LFLLRRSFIKMQPLEMNLLTLSLDDSLNQLFVLSSFRDDIH